jgi:hypothetical protein
VTVVRRESLDIKKMRDNGELLDIFRTVVNS